MTISPEREEEDARAPSREGGDELEQDVADVGPPPEAHSAAIDPAYVAAVRRAQAIGSGASWLLWIAGLSLVNIALAVSRSDFSFAIGLFVSQLVAVVGATIAHESGAPAVGWIAGVVAAI